ncbi:MAG TPA: 16S rRNA (cytosine(1402)-N(4))-methyltransferase RsmH [Acidobacteriota bacterium]|nr:16S rRNA (cytosine(1402)-N(4))-methyltransferase RsmH [Acidobacteriota bacterium]
MSRANLQRKMGNQSSEILDAGHSPVMVTEVLEALRCLPGGTYVDATLGMTGHGVAILGRIQPGGLLVGLDRDKESLEIARTRLTGYPGGVRLVHDNFKNLPLILNNLRLKPIDGILLDLGVSSYQLLSLERGFSFQSDAMLDMRMDKSQRVTAADLINNLPEDQLADIIYRYGEERLSRRIAAAIVAERQKSAVTRCSQLADIVSQALRVRGHLHIHPATRTFQALRIAVNQELEGLDEFFNETLCFLKTGGRIVVIAFHSLEDRIVKTAFRRLSGQCVCDRPPDLCICPRQVQARVVTPRPLTPGSAELAANPRARSARLRTLEKV